MHTIARRVSTLLFLSFPALWAGTVNFTGAFNADNNVQLFYYTVQNTGPVNVFTTSFANGGFAPLLALFDSGGNLLFTDSGIADNNCVQNGTDPATGACYDSRFNWNSLAGQTYTVALTQYDNLALGPTLADGFFENVVNPGVPNFTAEPPFNISGIGTHFLLPNAAGPGDQRTGAWAITFDSADPTLTATAVPEPSSVGLVLIGCGLAAGYKRFRRTV